MTRLHARTGPRASGLRKAFEQEFFVVFPLIWFGILLSVWISNDVVAFDFHHYYWPAGDRLLHGETPYVHGPWYPSEVPVGFVYPAPAALAFTPIAAIPREIGDVVFTMLSVAAPFAALRLLDVRDFRCYGIVFLWAPVTFGVQTANLSMLLTVAVAAMWRYRDSPVTAGVLLGLVAAIKLFLFPLGLFFLLTRRIAAVAYGRCRGRRDRGLVADPRHGRTRALSRHGRRSSPAYARTTATASSGSSSGSAAAARSRTALLSGSPPRPASHALRWPCAAATATRSCLRWPRASS